MKIYFTGFIERMESKNKRQNRTEKQKNKTKQKPRVEMLSAI